MQEHQDFLICNVCGFNFNLSSHKPKSLHCGNGHTLCAECINNIFKSAYLPKCPFDRNVINSEKIEVNLLVCQMIEHNEQSKVFSCPSHPNILADSICLTERKMLCKFCNKDAHKKHNVKLIKDLKKAADAKVIEINELATKIQKIPHDTSEMAKCTKQSLKTLVINSFTNLMSGLKRAQDELLVTIDFVFGLESYNDAKQELLLKNNALVSEMKKDIAVLESNIYDENFFIAVDRKMVEYPLQIHVDQLRMEIDELSIKIVQDVKSYKSHVDEVGTKVKESVGKILEMISMTGFYKDLTLQVPTYKHELYQKKGNAGFAIGALGWIKSSLKL